MRGWHEMEEIRNFTERSILDFPGSALLEDLPACLSGYQQKVTNGISGKKLDQQRLIDRLG